MNNLPYFELYHPDISAGIISSSVGIAMGYGLGKRGSIPSRNKRIFSIP
jgi:hypothetical protein